MRNRSLTKQRGQFMTEYLLISVMLVLPLIMPQACGPIFFVQGQTSVFNQIQDGLDQREAVQKQILFQPLSQQTLLMQGE